MGLDKDSFDRLFRERYPSLCSFACKYIEDPVESEDLVQEVFISLWEKRAEMDRQRSIGSYLYTAVKNSCMNLLKHQAVRQRFTTAEIHKREQPAFFKDSLIEEETHRLVTQAINQLPEKCKAVILLNIEGLKNHEIAGQLNISINTVKTQKVIAYRQLRARLKPALALLPLLLPHIPS